MRTPSTPHEFKAQFQSWPEDSLATRREPLGPGSAWDISEIRTFQVIRKPPKRSFPSFLAPHISEALEWVEGCGDVQDAISLMGEGWRRLSHQELRRRAGEFKSFFTLLAQVLEAPISSDPRQGLRSQIAQASATSAAPAFSSSPPRPASLSSLPSLPSSPIQHSSKRQRQDRSSDSYIPSEQSDQSSYDHRAKSEVTTNSCIYELLHCATELFRTAPDPSIYLEWSITQDTFNVQAGALSYSTTNDGSLVHRAPLGGNWCRASSYSYCSIEASPITTLFNICLRSAVG
jgi:hypothetical protein